MDICNSQQSWLLWVNCYTYYRPVVEEFLTCLRVSITSFIVSRGAHRAREDKDWTIHIQFWGQGTCAYCYWECVGVISDLLHREWWTYCYHWGWFQTICHGFKDCAQCLWFGWLIMFETFFLATTDVIEGVWSSSLDHRSRGRPRGSRNRRK